MNRIFKYASSVRTALANHEPVVALESTILTHGLPRPVNIEVARQCEDVIRAQGATPATIFVNKGAVHIGAEPDELELLCMTDEPATKVSRRDLPGVLARGGLGGTTVSGTSLCAHAAGIEVFATGGLGGVHRGAETTMDISADLYELSRTPIFVVCSGVKSILDIGRTLEVLESLGVGVYTMGESAQFPAFYVRDSGFKSPGGAIDPIQAAAIIKRHAQLQLKSGALFANPLPVEHEADGVKFERLIEQAVAEADKQGVTGAASTPFILARLAELSEGETVATNIALVVNNAKTAARVAVERYHNKNQSGLTSNTADSNTVVVVGMSNIDTIWHANSDDVVDGGASNIGTVTQTFGGVGYNLALAAGRACTEYPPILLTAVGVDHFAEQIRSSTSSVRLNCVRIDAARTGQYTCIVKPDGELAMAIQDMKISAAFKPNLLPKAILKKGAALLVDLNLPSATLNYVATYASPSRPLYVEPTSVFKIPGRCNVLQYAEAAFPNLDELLTFKSCLVDCTLEPNHAEISILSNEIKQQDNWAEQIVSIARDVFATKKGPKYFLVTVADKGVLYIDDTTSEHYDLERHVDWDKVGDAVPCHVNGCGDTLAGVYVASITGPLKMNRQDAIRRALTAAQISLRSPKNVPDQLPSELQA